MVSTAIVYSAPQLFENRDWARTYSIFFRETATAAAGGEQYVYVPGPALMGQLWQRLRGHKYRLASWYLHAQVLGAPTIVTPWMLYQGASYAGEQATLVQGDKVEMNVDHSIRHAGPSDNPAQMFYIGTGAVMLINDVLNNHIVLEVLD